MAVPHTKPHVERSPIYRGGNSKALIREKYGIQEIAKLSSNENPLPTSEHVQRAISNALSELNRYPPATDIALREDLAAYIGRDITSDHLFTGNGGCDILDLIVQSFLTPGDEAIVCPPTFPVYELTIRRTGATSVRVPLRDDFSLDVPGILQAVNDKTKLLYLCSPNNPTGSIVTQAEFDQLMADLPDSVIIVSDEVYHHFNQAENAVDSFPNLDRNLIIVHSFSKVFGMAGLRLGYGIARPELAQYISRSRLPFHLNSLTMIAARAGLADRTHLEETVSLTLSERDRLYRTMNQMDAVTVWPTEANFLLFQTPKDSKEMAEALQSEGTIVRELGGFYMPGYLRVSVGQPAENSRFLDNLARLTGST